MSSEEQMLGYFLAGLRTDIRSQVRPHDPKELNRAMEIACDIETTMHEIRKYGNPPEKFTQPKFRYQGNNGIVSQVESIDNNTTNTHTNTRRFQDNFRSNFALTESKPANNTFQPSRPNRLRGTRSLPYHEYICRREENKCYHCGLDFGAGHRCPNKNLRLIILADNENTDTT